MSEPSKRPRKSKKLPDNITEMEDKEVAKYLFGEKAAKELEKEVSESNSESDNPDKK